MFAESARLRKSQFVYRMIDLEQPVRTSFGLFRLVVSPGGVFQQTASLVSPELGDLSFPNRFSASEISRSTAAPWAN